MPFLSAHSSAPLVSYLVLCHQHVRYLAECLASLEAQCWPHAEVIVMDNASTDGSRELLQAWASQTPLKVDLMLETERRGICKNLNRMLDRAHGDYVALISADDYWLPHKTTRQVEVLERLGSAYAVAYSDALRVDESGRPLKSASFIAAHREFEVLPCGDVLAELLRGPFIPAMSALVRRSALEEMGAFDEHLVYEDYDAWLRLADRSWFHADPEALCAYRVLSNSAIHTIAAQSQPGKVLSDARIMAKAAQIARLEPQQRRNTLRRVVRLAIELLDHSGPWAPAIQSLHDTTQLAALQLLANAASGIEPLDAAAAGAMLIQAAKQGTLTSADAEFLPQSLRDALKIPHLRRRR